MQRATHPTAIAIIREHVEAWRREMRWSRETVADMFVQAHNRIGGPAITGMAFEPQTTDTFERMRVNADRVFRWLDDSTKDKNLLPHNFFPSILAGFPEDRRIMLLNDLLQQFGLHVESSAHIDEEVTHEEIVTTLQQLVDHSAQATVATSKLIDGVHAGEAEHAEAKIGLARATFRKAGALMSRIIRKRRTA